MFINVQAHKDYGHQDIRVTTLRWALAMSFDCSTNFLDVLKLLLWVTCTKIRYIYLQYRQTYKYLALSVPVTIFFTNILSLSLDPIIPFHNRIISSTVDYSEVLK